jgi:hypothetical protein
MPVYPDQFYPINILGEGSGTDWKVYRWPFVETATETLAKMQAGFLVKFNAAGTAVVPALIADAAVVCGVLVDLPDPGDDPTKPTVAVAMQGTFNRNQVHYASAHAENPPVVLNEATLDRLRTLNIFLDPAVPAGAFAP